ncbi:MAG: Fmu (Sun) domain-containing protein, partial [Ferruginibacter sp.]
YHSYLNSAKKIIAATFLCEQTHSDFLNFHKPEWNDLITKPIAEKMKILGLTSDHVFPWADELGAGVESERFTYSFFDQPGLFLRIRPGKKDTVIKKLQDAGLKFDILHDDCMGLPNATKVDAVLEIDKEVVIQDHNSQQVLNFLKDPANIEHPVHVWDCCAASGGKSMLAYDILHGKIELTVSDIRENILANLKKRFETAGIKKYTSFISDLSKNNSHPTPHKYQVIICDAPCTGSGTWSRTPEQLFFFKPSTIDVYVEMQQKIVRQAASQLRKSGVFIYVTCSVFKKENEGMVNFLKQKFHLQLLQMELLKGYDKKADSMFVAVFRK